MACCKEQEDDNDAKARVCSQCIHVCKIQSCKAHPELWLSAVVFYSFVCTIALLHFIHEMEANASSPHTVEST